MKIDEQIKLYIFDRDKTLTEAWNTKFLPGVEEFFRMLSNLSNEDRPQLAIATNQGGVGLRYWREKVREDGGDIGNPNETPPVEIFERDLGVIIQQIFEWSGVLLEPYRCYAYQSKKGIWGPTPDDYKNSPFWRHDWRKPEPGMLVEAMKMAGVTARQTLFIGDDEVDMAASVRALCGFCWAWDFFGFPKPERKEEEKRFHQEGLFSRP